MAFHAALLLLLALQSFSAVTHGSAISTLAVYTDSACTLPYTNDSSWQSWGSLQANQVPSQYIGAYGPCVTSPAPAIASGEFFCVGDGSGTNTSVNSLGALEWLSNSTCPAAPAGQYDLSYYFSGRPGTCAQSDLRTHCTTIIASITISVHSMTRCSLSRRLCLDLV